MKNLIYKTFMIFVTIFFALNVNYANTEITNNTSGYEQINPELLKWNEGQKIKLLPHQLKPINYLEQNSDIKGLLIYHDMGSGKTFLALGFAERNPSKKVVIFAPMFLVNHWKNNLNHYGVTDKSRYNIISHKKPDELLKLDLSNTIIIIDESHNIINKIADANDITSSVYSAVYVKIRSAYKILSLTGTPVFNNAMDMDYQINLVSGQDLLPYNQEYFRKDYMKVDSIKSIPLGYFLDSKLFGVLLSPLFSAHPFFSISILPLITPLLNPILFIQYFINNIALRNIDVDLLEVYLKKYVSYYTFTGVDANQYPTKHLIEKQVDYNSSQMDFLFRFTDNLLDDHELALLNKDKDIDLVNLKLKNYELQKTSKERGFYDGLIIGNLVFKDKEDKIVFPEKFIQAFKVMQSTDRPVVIYSNFYHTGILLFKKFLDYNGMKEHYDIVLPEVSQEEFTRVINKYNSGKTKFLLLHPEITEGISLMGTAQIHILESPPNSSMLAQIIGRVVRYKSHVMLPEKMRNVEVYIWMQEIRMFDFNHWAALRRHHHYTYPEIRYDHALSSMMNHDSYLKNISPDSIVYKLINDVKKNISTFVEKLKLYSIDNN